jgi:sugar lactone lactonase YvrE
MLCAVAFSVGCSGNSGGTPSPSASASPVKASPSASASPISSPNPSATPTGTPTAYPTGSLYVTNDSGVPTPVQGSSPAPIVWSVSIFAPNANGNATPLGTIAGSNTGLTAPVAVAVDGAGRIYVADEAAAITVFAPGANGNATPIETISGSKTGLKNPQSIALDSSGNIYVADDGAQEILDFGPLTPGTQNIAPLAVIGGAGANFGTGPSCLTIFSGQIYTCTGSENGSPTQIESFPLGTSGMSAAPSSTLTSSDFDYLVGVAFDPSGNAYVETTTSQTLDVFNNTGGAAPTGNAPPAEMYASGQSDGYGPALDAAGNVYVADGEPNSVEVFPPFVSGESGAAAIRTIAGSNTGLDRPSGLAVH